MLSDLNSCTLIYVIIVLFLFSPLMIVSRTKLKFYLWSQALSKEYPIVQERTRYEILSCTIVICILYLVIW